MRAAYFEAFGDADVIKVGDVEIPALQEGELLIKIKAAGVNPVDAAVTKGYLNSFIPTVFPVIPGWDVAGVIEERGFSARRFRVGDEVYGYARRPVVHWGTFAEYIVLPETYLSLRPQNISWEESAGIPLAGLTAYQSLFTAGNLQQGQTVLILGASGGIGTMAIQMAKSKGAVVMGVASKKNQTYMKELGAAYTIDYQDKDVGRQVLKIFPHGVDLIFDAANGETLQQSLTALKKGGTLVSLLNKGTGIDKSIHFQYVFVEPDSTQLNYLRVLADEGAIKVQVSETYPLEKVPDAIRQIETHHTRGKIIIIPS